MTLRPLESFLKEYVDSVEGLWDEVEPQVYDLLPPESGWTVKAPHADEGVIRVAFDPEALAEHPTAQFMTLGSPLLDEILEDAQRRGRFAKAYIIGLHLRPAELSRQISRAVNLPEGALMRLLRARGLNFPVAVFWFAATFLSDQKEQEKLVVAMDLYHGRQVRHLDQLLEPGRLSETPAELLPDAPPTKNLVQAYLHSRERALRNVFTIANQYRRDHEERFLRQEARMRQYYQDLREEIEEQIARAESRSTDTSRALARRQAVDQEEALRLAELRRKNALRVHLKLLNILEIRQPKLLIETTLTPSCGEPAPLSLVWDPLMESLEAPDCPECGQPTFAFRFRLKCPTWLCPDCAAQSPARVKEKKRT
jgi:hypothetical protein